VLASGAELLGLMLVAHGGQAGGLIDHDHIVISVNDDWLWSGPSRG
jgi:hypothetical protein